MREWVGRVKHNLHIFEPVLPPPISSELKTENFSSVFFKISCPPFFLKRKEKFSVLKVNRRLTRKQRAKIINLDFAESEF